MTKKLMILMTASLLLVLVIMGGCSGSNTNQDPGYAYTLAAGTVQAELTRISALTPSATPTLEPTATNTPEPPTPTVMQPSPAATTPVVLIPSATQAIILPVGTSTPDNAKWMADVTIPDNSPIAPNAKFTKTWRILNAGTTTWNKDYRLIFIDTMKDGSFTGQLLGTIKEVNLTKDVKPNESIDVSVDMVAPGTTGTYTSYWRMLNPEGLLFGESLTVVILVTDGSTTVVPSATP